MRELVDSFYKERSIVNHQIASYNDFLERRLQNIVDSTIIGQEEEMERGYIYPEIEGYKIKFGKIKVKSPEVKEADGSHVGILYTDYFPRESKRGGAFMSSFRKQYKKDGKNITPVIYNVGNFSKPTGDKPSLITLEEVSTLFHEFGHALHGLLSNQPERNTT